MINRTSAVRRLHTAALADAGPDVHEHAVGARVMTCDGHPGTVTAVNTGPFPGTESYRVDLDGGMGGGDYDGGQIWPLPAARTAGTAAADYPELAQILVERPDPARGMKLGFLGSRLAAAQRECDECGDAMSHHEWCGSCGDEHHSACHRDLCLECGEDIGERCEHCDDGHHSDCCPDPDAGVCQTCGNRHIQPERGCTFAEDLAAARERMVGEHAPTLDNHPIEHSIGEPCTHCRTPMSHDAREYGCVFCGAGDHHSYCCPSPDGRTAARRTAGAICDSCADRSPGASMIDCPHCGSTHHNRAACCPLNCADCGARMGAGSGACAHCGYGDHHSECCTMACTSCEGPLREGGRATCAGCDTDRAGHHPGCCPVQKPMGYRDGDEDLCPTCAHATGAIDHPLYRNVDGWCDHCAAPISLPRRRYTTAGITAVLAAAEMSLGEAITPSPTYGPGPTKPRSPHDNPASMGWASAPDPDQWSAAPLFPLDSRVGAAGGGELGVQDYCTACGKDDHSERGCPQITGAAWFLRRMEHKAESNGHLMASPTSHSDHEGSPWQLGLPFHHFRSYCYGCGADIKSNAGGTSGASSPRIGQPCANPSMSQLDAHGSLSTLHDEPEAALPTTDGTVNADDADPEALNPMEFSAFLADFQKRATHLHTAGSGDGDVAAAAAAFLSGAPAGGTAGLSKSAMRDFTPAEQRILIEESPGVRAGNADRLDLTGTHYADLAALRGDEEDDDTWLI